MSQFTDDKLDIRVMTLQKWNLPQTCSICKVLDELEKLNCLHTAFVSFRNFHLVDISRVEISGDKPDELWTKAHETVCKARKHAMQVNQKIGTDERSTDTSPMLAYNGMHIQQSMLLVGRDPKFWIGPQTLLITMFQLTNDEKMKLEEVEEWVAQKMDEQEIKRSNYSLYYSMDFCDLVLFTKETPLKQLLNAAWEITCTKGDKERYIRDAITVYAFSGKVVQEEFTSLSQKQDKFPQFVSGGFDLHLSCNIQDYRCYETLEKKLKEYEFSPEYWSTPGRNDVEITIRNCDYEKLLQVAFLLEQAQGEDGANTIGSCEIYPYVEESPHLTGKSASVEVNCGFQEILKNLYQTVQKWEQKKQLPEEGYAGEILQSLGVLAKNGFTDEFLLCVLEPLIGYVKYVKYVENSEMQHSLPEDWDSKIRELTRSLTMAINLVSHSTMHSDRVFIQAPSFQVQLFDVPPKLLAFYAAVTHEITKYLRDKAEQEFYFLFNPDFRKDIHVKRISPGGPKGNHVSVIYLSEKILYHPDAVIALLCHEIAHQVGTVARRRKERAEYIFTAIAGFLLAPLLSDVDLLEKLSKGMGKVLLELYQKSEQSEQEGEYYLESISDWIRKEDFLQGYILDSQAFYDEVLKTWVESFCNEISDEKYKVLADPGNVLGITRYEKLEVEARISVCLRLFLEKFKMISNLQYLDNQKKGVSLKKRYDLFNYTIDAYREAYSDLKMVELLGIDRRERYEELLQQIGQIYGESRTGDTIWKTPSNLWRKAAICGVLDQNYTPDDDWFVKGDTVERKLAYEQLKQYLARCYEGGSGDTIQRMRDILHKRDPRELFAGIRERLFTYRDEIVQDVRMYYSSRCNKAHGMASKESFLKMP